MLDHARKWNPAPDWSTATLIGNDVAVRSVELPDQFLISGDLAAFGRLAGMDATGVGAFGQVSGAAYTIRLARDRLLLVGPLPDKIHYGWNTAGFAVTAVGGADHVLELTGEGVRDLLLRATTVDAGLASPSAALGFASVPAIAYRWGPASALRVHVERGLAVYVWTWLTNVLTEGDGGNL